MAIPRWQTDPNCKKCEIRLTKFGLAMSVEQLQFIKERAHIVACLKKDRKDIESFSKFLFDKTDIGVLDCQGLVDTEKLAGQILSHLEGIGGQK